jgi:hypothetical protein
MVWRVPTIGRLSRYLMLLLTALPIRGAAQATIFPSEGTTVDGFRAIADMHVFAGSVIRTPAAKQALLRAEHASIQILGNSELQFGVELSQLNRNSVMLSTTAKHAIRCRCVTAIPSSTTQTTYVVQLVNDKENVDMVYVHAEAGDLVVKASKDVILHPKKTIVVDCTKPVPPMVLAGESDAVSKAIMGLSIAASPTILIPKHSMSGEHPDRP